MAATEELHLLSPFTSLADINRNGPQVIVSGKGCRVQDRQGREYLDAMAGLWCMNVGYGREEIVQAIAEQARRLAFYHSFMGNSNEPSIELARLISTLTPGDLNRVFFGLSGSDSNDTHVKLVWYYNNLLGRPEKKKFIARKNAYHGVTVASASLTGLPPIHAKFDLPLPRFIHVGRPHHYWDAHPGETEREFSARLAKELEDTILREGPETVAAFIAEPVMGAGGVIVHPEGYFDAVLPILRKYDVLFICDEVICGFGRLGAAFGATYYGLKPDLMTIAKGLTSGYVPMAAAIVSEQIYTVLSDASPETGPFAHGFTYSAHPVSAAAGVANINLMLRERLFERAAETSHYFQRRLREAFSDHPLVGEVRGVGMVAGIEIVADKAAKKPFDMAAKAGIRLAGLVRAEGLIVRPINNTLALSPPLVITPEEIDEAVEKLARAMDRFEL